MAGNTSPGDYVGFLPLGQEADSKPQACLARTLPSLPLPNLMHIFFSHETLKWSFILTPPSVHDYTFHSPLACV